MNLLNKIRSEPSNPSHVSRINSEENRSQGIQARSLAKAYILMGITAVLALASGYLISANSFALGVICLVFFIAFFLVQSIALKYTKEALLASIVDALGLMLFFYQENFIYLLFTIFLIWILFVYAHRRGKEQIDNMVKISFWRSVRPVVGIMLMALTVFFSFVFFINGRLFLQDDNIGKAIDVLVTPIMKGYVDDFSSDMISGDLIESLALNQLEEQEEFNALNKFQKDEQVSQATVRLLESFNSSLGYEIDTTKSVKSNVGAIIANYTEGLSTKSAPLRIGLLFIALLMVVKSIEIVLYVPLVLLGFMLYELMIAFNIIAIQFESRSKEVINIIEN